MKKNKYILFSLFSGLLLASSFPPQGFSAFIFISFVPLLWLEKKLTEEKAERSHLPIMAYSAISFFIWNALKTYWIYNASKEGAVMAVLFNTLLMTLTFYLFHRIKKRLNKNLGYVFFISIWIAFEYLHLRWDLSWPWLTTGNVFSENIKWIQWYEFTGTLGGSLWVLLVNVLLFDWSLKLKVESSGFKVPHSRFNIQDALVALCVLLLPTLFSVFLYDQENKKIKDKLKINVVVVQPNIDPYNEKFDGSFENQIKKMLLLAEQKIDSATQILVLPETAITENLWEGELQESESIKTINEFIKKHPNISIVTGASTAKIFLPNEKHSATARKFTNEDIYYDSYNTALLIDSSGNTQVYHKSKLVPGVEKMPFPKLFKPLEKYALDLGGTVGSLGVQDEPSVFKTKEKILIAPVICYESVYGEYVAEYVQQGANLICIITNDGWWGDTPGYKQHASYASLRAIENRKSIARSANTGISCFVNSLGNITQPTGWWKEAVIKESVAIGGPTTFYTKHGDYIGIIAIAIVVIIFLYSIVRRFLSSKNS